MVRREHERVSGYKKGLKQALAHHERGRKRGHGHTSGYTPLYVGPLLVLRTPLLFSAPRRRVVASLDASPSGVSGLAVTSLSRGIHQLDTTWR